ncbi:MULTISPECIES: hypothetical protein [Legionella]|uniref:hypothetical protein n=1 Tax=Legionella TaxID=445 RepID=UPI00095A5809|nr:MULTISPECIES: hypothetical protein [Legionella]MBN9226648.1 hypothetical protein [Legionella steelei]OJW15429.1 MAG: hypothetical protein BGO44_11315 [Legionella sp. 39-23]
MPKGIVPFRVDFEKNGVGVSTRAQAAQILDEVARQHANGAKTVGITYSANQAQTDKIQSTYKNGGWKTGTDGSNQAAVISEIEQLLTTPKYQHLQGVYRTVPITTMKYDSTGKAVKAKDTDVEESLKGASKFMDDGGVLLGWTNQTTAPGRLAIGGGVASGVQTSAQKSMINNWVKNNLSSPTLDDDLPMAPLKPTVSETSSVQALQASEEEEAQRKKKSIGIQSEQVEALLAAYKKHCGEQWFKDNPPEKGEDGRLKLTFKSDEDMTDFFKKQAESGNSFIMVDEKTNKVIAYSNGDGKLYKPGKDGPQEITGKTLLPKAGEMNDLPDLKDFKMPAKAATQESVSQPQ